MKKLLSIFLSTALIVSSLVIPTIVSAEPSIGTIDYAGEKIINVPTGSQYSVNGKSWITIYSPEGILDISTLIKNKGGKLYIRSEAQALANTVPDPIAEFAARPTINQKSAEAKVSFDGLGEVTGKTGAVGILKNMDGKEFRIGVSEWMTPELDGTNMDVSAFRNTGATLKVRIKAKDASGGTPASLAGVAINVKIPKKPLTPKSVKYDIKTDVFKGVNSKMEYALLSGAATNVSMASLNIAYTKIVNPSAKSKKNTLTRNDIGFGNDGGDNTLGVRLQATSGKFASDPVALPIMPKNTETPATPQLDLVAEQITGLTTDMEYRLKAGTPATAKKPTPVPGVIAENQKWVTYKNPKAATNDPTLTGTLAITSSLKAGVSGQIEIRTKADETKGSEKTPSTSVVFELPPRAVMETAADKVPKIDFANEALINVTDKFAYLIGDGSWTPATLSDAGLSLVNIGALSAMDAETQNTKATALKIRIAPTADGKTAASTTKTINIPKRPARPQSTYNVATDEILRVANTQSYIKNDQTLDQAVAFSLGTAKKVGRDVMLDEAATIKIFVKEKATAFRSPFTIVEWPAVVPNTVTELAGVSLNYDEVKVDGLVADKMQYRIVTSTSANPGWTNVTSANAEGKFIAVSINTNTSALARKLQVRLKHEAGPPAKPASQPKEIPLPVKAAKPELDKDDVDLDAQLIKSVVAGESTMQLKIGNGAWGPITLSDGGLDISAGGTFAIRTPATSGSAIASDAITFEVTKQTTVPSPSYNSTSDRVTGVNNKMEYKTNASATWTAITGTKTALTRTDLGTATSVIVRFKGSVANPTSAGLIKVTLPSNSCISIETVKAEAAADIVEEAPVLIEEEPAADIAEEEVIIEETADPAEEIVEEAAPQEEVILEETEALDEAI